MDKDSLNAISLILFVCDSPDPVDLAFVLGSPTVNSIYPALDMFHAGLTQKIVISGAGKSTSGQPEWELYRDHALAAGIPSEALLLEKLALNTQENFELGSNLIMQALGWGNIKSVALCAKPFHMRRVLMTARRYFRKMCASLLARLLTPLRDETRFTFQTLKASAGTPVTARS